MAIEASGPPMQLTLSCVLVGLNDTPDFSISIAHNANWNNVLHAVIDHTQLPHTSDELRVFLAFDGTQWLPKHDPTVAALQTGQLPRAIRPLLTPAKQLHTGQIHDVFTAQPTAGDGVIHLLVCLPGSLVEWQPDATPVYSLSPGHTRLYFVVEEREAAFQTLLQVHEAIATRTTLPMPIALLNSGYGLGMKAFTRHYLRLCRATDESTRPPHVKTLCESHWVPVATARNMFCSLRCPIEQRFRGLVLHSVEQRLQQSPDCSHVMQRLRAASPHEFPSLLVQTLGPVFLSVHKIGYGFIRRVPDDVARASFVTFCDTVVRPWSQTGRIFFVLVGNSDGLSDLGQQRTEFEREAANRIQFVRLPLSCLRPESIATVLKNTRAERHDPRSISECWRLTSDEDVATAAEIVYWKTSGDPTRVARVLRKYQELREHRCMEESVPASSLELVAHASSSEAVMELVARFFTRPPSFLSHLEAKDHVYRVKTGYSIELDDCLNQWRSVLAQYTASFVNPFDATISPTPINLHQDSGLQIVFRREGDHDFPTERMTLYWIMSKCGVAWQGTMNSATLYAEPSEMARILHKAFPFRAFAEFIAPAPEQYDTALPWLCTKRLQQLFTTPTEPSEALPAFLGSVDRPTLLSTYGAVRFSLGTGILPHIRPASRSWDRYETRLDISTANQRAWPVLMRQITDLLVGGGEDDGAATFTFPPLSESPDAIFFMKGEVEEAMETPGTNAGTNSGTANWRRTLIVGLTVAAEVRVTVAADGTATVADNELVLAQFDCIFLKIDQEHAVFGDVTAVLLVAVTRATRNTQLLFAGRLFHCEDIQTQHQLAGSQAIFLDLTDRAKRAQFFGWNEASDGRLLDAVDVAIEYS